MIVLAMYTLNFFHPGIYLREDYTSQDQTGSGGTSSGPEGMVMEGREKPTYSQGKAV